MIFCTYFDSAYLARARVCLQTLFEHGEGVRVYVLALDDKVRSALDEMPGVIPISLAEIEAYRPALLSVKRKRKRKEYYATITPILPQLVFEVEDPNEVYYTDADMAFWGPLRELDIEMGHASLLVSAHENPVAHPAGRFNVGILGYRNDNNCKEFLTWWEARCMEWCEWRATPDGKCADQGYLNIIHDEPEKFQNVKISEHPGINLGPWNLAMHKLETQEGYPTIDGRRLVCYHYHGYKPAGQTCLNNTGWDVSDEAMRVIYQPYHELMMAARK